MPDINSAITVAASFCLISAFITCGLGFFVYAQKPSSTVHRLFLAVMLSAAYWATGEFFIWQAESPEGVIFWLKFSSFWPLTIAFSSHFILAFTEKLPQDKKRRNIILIAGIYIPAIALSIIGIFTDCLFVAGYDPVAGYIYLPTENNLICPIEIIYTLTVMIWSLYVGFTSWQHAGPEKKRSQNRLLFTGITAIVISGAVSGTILPLMNIHIPNLVFIGFVICSILIVLAIQRYGLFTLTPETAVPEIMKTMPDGLILVDQNSDIVAVNESAEKIFSSLKKSPVGISVKSLIPDEDCSVIFDSITEHGEITDYELSISGDIPEYVSISGSAVSDSADRPSGIVLIARDITERKASERALQAANSKLSMLSRLTRHDIGNLVTALSGYLCLMEDELKNNKNERYLHQSLEIVDMIIRQLEFSRSYQQIGSEKPQWIRLLNQVKHAKESIVHENIEITVVPDPVLIYADPLLEKVLYNLLENAVRHGERITEITISTEEQRDGSLILRFSDDGIGIPAEDKEKIFSYGYGKNTGFGLAFSRELLSVTGIEITERGVYGEGASFEIKVPAGAWRKENNTMHQKE